MSKIIAFTGFKSCGKTTASNYLKEEYGFVSHNFKDALVAEIKEKFPDLLNEILNVYSGFQFDEGLVVPDIEDLFTTKPPLMRALMVNYGTEVRRGDDKRYWSNQWIKSVLPDYNNDMPVVCDDCRFITEMEAVRQLDGTIIRLTRPDIESGGDHSSETEQLQIEADYEIELVPGEVSLLCDELDKILQ